MDRDRQSILVVEDEALIRMVAVAALRDAGFVVLEASNVLEAVGLLAGHDEIAIVFTDVDMPGGLNGIDLAMLVARTRPRTQIVVTSGAPENKIAAVAIDAVFVAKPYSLDAMIAVICDCVPSSRQIPTSNSIAS